MLTLQSVPSTLAIQFDGGIGLDTDELRLDGQPVNWRSDPRFNVVNTAAFSSVSWSERAVPETYSKQFGVLFRNTELVTVCPMIQDATVEFDAADNDVSIRKDSVDSPLSIADATSKVTIQLLFEFVPRANIYGGGGDDRISVDSLPSELSPNFFDFEFFGEDGNDTLIGSNGDDYIVGGSGDDSILGQDGNDDLSGDTGTNWIDGGGGGGDIIEESWPGIVRLGPQWIASDDGRDNFVNIGSPPLLLILVLPIQSAGTR